MKKKNYFQYVWWWLLEMGPLKAFLLLKAIGLVVIVLLMWALHWFTRHSR